MPNHSAALLVIITWTSLMIVSIHLTIWRGSWNITPSCILQHSNRTSSPLLQVRDRVSSSAMSELIPCLFSIIYLESNCPHIAHHTTRRYRLSIYTPCLKTSPVIRRAGKDLLYHYAFQYRSRSPLPVNWFLGSSTAKPSHP
jgi:hypothetical protein